MEEKGGGTWKGNDEISQKNLPLSGWAKKQVGAFHGNH
jgi:hypothetical protein